MNSCVHTHREAADRTALCLVASAIAKRFAEYILKHRLCAVLATQRGPMTVGICRQAPYAAALDAAAPTPLALAVEVEYPSTAESQQRLAETLMQYRSDGTTVWVVYPDSQEVEVRAPNQAVRIVDIDGTLDGGEALPGFTLAVRDFLIESGAPSAENEEGTAEVPDAKE